MGMENVYAQYITLKCIPPMCYVFVEAALQLTTQELRNRKQLVL